MHSSASLWICLPGSNVPCPLPPVSNVTDPVPWRDGVKLPGYYVKLGEWSQFGAKPDLILNLSHCNVLIVMVMIGAQSLFGCYVNFSFGLEFGGNEEVNNKCWHTSSKYYEG